LDCQYYADLATWYHLVAPVIKEAKAGMAGAMPEPGGVAPAAPGAVPGAPGAAPAPGMPPAAPGMPPGAGPGVPPIAAGGVPPAGPGVPPGAPPAGQPAAPAADEGPKGEGWVIQLIGYHFHNENRTSQGAQYVRDAFLKKLETGVVPLPVGKDGKLELVPLKELGIGNPVLVESARIRPARIPDPDAEEVDKPDGQKGPSKTIEVQQFDFVVQFSWQETPLSKRLQQRQELEKAKPADGNVVAAPAGP
jgi:type IV pilus assembly protein PilM